MIPRHDAARGEHGSQEDPLASYVQGLLRQGCPFVASSFYLPVHQTERT
jgi:hypothetical protein